MKLNVDREQIFEEHIKPLVDELEKACYRNRIPMFASFAVKDDGKETIYRNTYISPKTLLASLSDDQLTKHVQVIQGYRVISPEDDTEFAFSE